VIDEIREQLRRIPFVPFVPRTSDDHEYSVPTTPDSVITPRGNRVVLVDGEGTSVFSRLRINNIVEQQANGE
jgi:hypothetical protein